MIFISFALNRLYLEGRVERKHTAATRRIRLSYPEVLISWQITGIGTLSILNVYLKHSISHNKYIKCIFKTFHQSH